MAEIDGRNSECINGAADVRDTAHLGVATGDIVAGFNGRINGATITDEDQAYELLPNDVNVLLTALCERLFPDQRTNWAAIESVLRTRPDVLLRLANMEMGRHESNIPYFSQRRFIIATCSLVPISCTCYEGANEGAQSIGINLVDRKMYPLLFKDRGIDVNNYSFLERDKACPLNFVLVGKNGKVLTLVEPLLIEVGWRGCIEVTF